MKVVELFESEILNEDLGNLKVIDKKFQKFLKYNTIVQRQTRTQNEKRKMMLLQTLGSESPVEKRPVKSAAEAFRAFKDDENVKIIAINLGGKQVAFIARIPEPDFRKGKWIYLLAADGEVFVPETEDDRHNQVARFDAELDQAGFQIYLNRSSRECNESAANKAVGALFKLFKELGRKDIELVVVKTDTRKREKANERYKSRDTRRLGLFDKGEDLKPPATPPSDGKTKTSETIKNYENQMKSEFQARLNNFKANKAPSVKTPEELIKLIEDSGYVEKIKVKSLKYSLEKLEIDLKKLKQTEGDTWHRAYAEYSLVDSGPEYELYRKKLKAALEVATDDADREHMTEHYKAPRTLYVFLKLVNNKITVDKVSVDKFSAFA